VTFFPRTALVVLAASTGAASLAGCGSSGGPTGATTAGPAGRPSYAQAVKFSQCMRAAGVSNFPDPSPGGGLEIREGSGVNPGAPAFQAAQKKCGKLLPGGKMGPSKPTKAQFQRALAFAKCVRAHGLRTFPDPLSTPPTGRGLAIDLQGMIFVPGSGFDPRSPAFRRAASQCGVSLPSGQMRGGG
jgi:hypothetical protein